MTDFSLEFVFASGEKHSPKAEPNEWLLRSDADTVADSLTVRFSVGKRLFTEEPVGAARIKRTTKRCARAFCGAFTHCRTARTRRRTAVRR